MEDSHIADLELGYGVAVFGVFDGHGGKKFKDSLFKGDEVAMFVKRNFV